MRENKALGLLLTDDSGEGLGELCQTRTSASLPFGGRYRLIDFMLSNMMYSKIYDVGVFTKSKYESLMGHLGSGREWDMARKSGGLVLLPPNVDNNRVSPYSGELQLLCNYRGYIAEAHARYVVLADADLIGHINFDEMITQHAQSNADVTLACRLMGAEDRVSAKNVLLSALEGRVTDVSLASRPKEGSWQYMGVLVLEKQKLLEVTDDLCAHSKFRLAKDLIQGCHKKLDMRVYPVENCVKITSLQEYYDLSMQLLKKETRGLYFNRVRPVLTRVRDEVPVRYGEHAVVKNSLIADGCIIEGTVENCVLFRRVMVAKGAVLRDSIIMEGCEIGEDATLQCVVADRRCRIKSATSLVGQKSYPVVIAKESII